MNSNRKIITPQFDYWMGVRTAKAHKVTLLERLQMRENQKRRQKKADERRLVQ